MISIDKDKHIKVIFKNNTVIEGRVQSWTKEQAILLSLDGSSSMVIFHPEKDILFVKVVADIPKDQNKESPSGSEIKDQISDKVRQILQPDDSVLEVHDEEPNVSSKEDLKGKTIAELKRLVNEQDKQIILNKIKAHLPDIGSCRNNYSTPFGTVQPASIMSRNIRGTK